MVIELTFQIGYIKNCFKMRIEMQQGKEVTDEIITLANGYDFHARFESDYKKQREIEANNYNIIVQLKKLGVKNLYSE